MGVDRKHFKGWAKPGPVPPGAARRQPRCPPDETLDAISGHFRIFQLRKGHRFSTDDVLTAWYGTTWAPAARRGARPRLRHRLGRHDRGVAAARRAVRDHRSAGREREAGAQVGRVQRARDSLRDPARRLSRSGALGADERFDLVLGSPPYFPLGTGIEGDHPQKVACRFELRGDISRLRPRRRRASRRRRFVRLRVSRGAARAGRGAPRATPALVIVRRRPVVFREGEPPLVDAVRDDARRMTCRRRCAAAHGWSRRSSFERRTAACTRNTRRSSWRSGFRREPRNGPGC